MIKGNLEHLTIPEGVEVYEINGPFFFGAGNRFEEVMAAFGDRPKVRIIRMRKVPFVDSTGIHNLTNLCEMSHKDGIQVVLSGVNPHVHAALGKAGFYESVGEENICSHGGEREGAEVHWQKGTSYNHNTSQGISKKEVPSTHFLLKKCHSIIFCLSRAFKILQANGLKQ